jgi:exosortase A-associated hydrolase 2
LETGGERMFFFQGSRNRRLLGFLHLPAPAKIPAASESGPVPVGIVYCHPFGEEKMASHAITVKTARRLCEDGAAVLRFDFSGCGDSEGELDETTLDDWNIDLACAIELLKREAGVERVGLWGLRLGASLVLEYAAKASAQVTSTIPFLVLWQPVPDPELFIKQFLRQKMSTEIAAKREVVSAGNAPAEGSAPGTVAAAVPASLKGLVQTLENGEGVEVIGYPVSAALFKSFAARAKPPLPSPGGYPVLVATASLSAEPAPGPRKIAEGLAQLGHDVRSEHVQEETFWDRLWQWNSPDLTAATARFVMGAR